MHQPQHEIVPQFALLEFHNCIAVALCGATVAPIAPCVSVVVGCISASVCCPSVVAFCVAASATNSSTSVPSRVRVMACLCCGLELTLRVVGVASGALAASSLEDRSCGGDGSLLDRPSSGTASA